MTESAPPAGMCVCGRTLPPGCPSQWACGEPCQAAWLAHAANPDYPHPRQIREAADRRRAAPRPAPDRPPDAAGDGCVQVGPYRQQTGPWTPRGDDLAQALQYRRWCPRCRDRRAPDTTPDAPDTAQRCGSCGHRWPGRPLAGVLEACGAPWPGLRIRLTDGYRSATRPVDPQTVAAAALGRRPVAEVAARWWTRLERRLGYTDQGPPRGGRARRWDWVAQRDPDTGRLSRPAP